MTLQRLHNGWILSIPLEPPFASGTTWSGLKSMSGSLSPQQRHVKSYCACNISHSSAVNFPSEACTLALLLWWYCADLDLLRSYLLISFRTGTSSGLSAKNLDNHEVGVIHCILLSIYILSWKNELS